MISYTFWAGDVVGFELKADVEVFAHNYKDAVKKVLKIIATHTENKHIPVVVEAQVI